MSSQLYKNCRILTIELWNFVKEFMPVAKSTGRPGIPAYIVLDAILWISDNGAKWRSLPYEENGNWNSFYKLFRAWVDKGIFKVIFENLFKCKRKVLLFLLIAPLVRFTKMELAQEKMQKDMKPSKILEFLVEVEIRKFTQL